MKISRGSVWRSKSQCGSSRRTSGVGHVGHSEFLILATFACFVDGESTQSLTISYEALTVLFGCRVS